MADAVKSDEIEDVLSSIRRLVSEHQPPVRSESVAAQDPAPTSHDVISDDAAMAPTDRLLLTPALRVTDPEDPWVPVVPRADDSAQTTENRSQEADIDREDGADWAQELWAETGEEQEAAPDIRADHALDPQLQSDQWEQSTPAADPDVQDSEADRLESPVDATEGLLQEVTSEPTDGDDIPDVPLSFIRSTKSVSDYEPEEDNDALSGGDLPTPTLKLAEARAAHAGDQHDDTPRVKVEIVRTPPAREAANTAETEIVQSAKGAEEPQPVAMPGTDAQDMASTKDRAEGGVADLWSEETEAPPEPLPMQEAEGDPVEDLGEAPFTFPDDSDGFVDEEALRAIIAEVVREELQGEMGVRITRNVRKLVRREIRIALTAQDIE